MSTTLDPQSLRRLMSAWATGVAVVTSRDDSGPRGATTNALTSLSLEPLLVLVALDRGSNTLQAISNSGRFCINVLASDQEEIARRFATKAPGEEKLAGVPSELVEGVPALGGVLAWLVCELERALDGGDHTIVLGRPLEAGADPERQPLVFYGGRFHAPDLARSGPDAPPPPGNRRPSPASFSSPGDAGTAPAEAQQQDDADRGDHDLHRR